MQLYWESCLVDLLTHLNVVIQLSFKFSFTAKMVKQKGPEWNVFDIIETQDNFQGKDDIDWKTMIIDYIIII